MGGRYLMRLGVAAASAAVGDVANLSGDTVTVTFYVICAAGAGSGSQAAARADSVRIVTIAKEP